MVGRQVSVLFERTGRLDGQLVGKSEHLQAVHVSCPEHYLGEIHRVNITKGEANSLGGVLA